MSAKIAWAYLRRWLYLLCVGIWRGEQSYTIHWMGYIEISTGKNFTSTTYEQTRCFYSGPTQ